MVMADARLVLRPGGSPSQVMVDGTDLANGCRAIDVHTEFDGHPMLTLHLLLPEITVDGEVRLWIPAATREALVALGWTPPPDGAGG